MTPAGSDTGIRHGSQDGEVRLEAILRGRVQGVGFRWFTVARATALGCTGWVANRPDGSVHVVAEAGRGVLEQLLAELREGPEGARVDAVAEVGELPAEGLLREGVQPARWRVLKGLITAPLRAPVLTGSGWSLSDGVAARRPLAMGRPTEGEPQRQAA